MSAANTVAPGPGMELEDYFLLAAVALLPWAFGGVELWAFRSAALLLVTGAGLALMREGWAGLGFGAGGDGAAWLTPAFLLATLAALQVVPLPPGVIRALSPATDAVYAEAFPGYGRESTEDAVAALEARALELVPEAEGAPLPPGPDGAVVPRAPECLSSAWRTLSLEPSATRERLAWYGALLLGFLAIRRRVADRRRRTVYLATLMTCSVLLALFALIQAETWNGMLYWIRPLRSQAMPFGPYVNPNHFAGVMEMSLPVLVGFCWARLRRRGRAAVYEALFAGAAVAAVLCLGAGVAASSKMAAALMAGSLLFLGTFGPRSFKMRAVAVGSLAVVISIGAFLLLETRLGERMVSFVEQAESGYLLEGRGAVWIASSAMIADFPLFGAGYGTFREVFPRYTPPGTSVRFAQAHNDYLEVLLDGGAVGFALLLWLVAGYATKVGGRLKRLGPSHRILTLGILAGVGTLAVHAFFDFNHQIPANALLFVALCAILVPADDRTSAAEEAL